MAWKDIQNNVSDSHSGNFQELPGVLCVLLIIQFDWSLKLYANSVNGKFNNNQTITTTTTIISITIDNYQYNLYNSLDKKLGIAKVNSKQ